jgi:hypothetical protein
MRVCGWPACRIHNVSLENKEFGKPASRSKSEMDGARRFWLHIAGFGVAAFTRSASEGWAFFQIAG